LVNLKKLKSLFWAKTDKEDRDLMFGYDGKEEVKEDIEVEDFKRFILKFFTSELQEINGKIYIQTKRLKPFLKHNY